MRLGITMGNLIRTRYRKSFEHNLGFLFEIRLCFKGRSVPDCRVVISKNVEAYNKDYIEEVQELLDGAGLKLEDIMVLNSRTVAETGLQRKQKRKADFSSSGS